MTSFPNQQSVTPAQTLDEAVAIEIGALRLEVIKLRVAVQQATRDAEAQLREKDRAISVLNMELDRNRTEAAKVIDATAVEKPATNGAIAH